MNESHSGVRREDEKPLPKFNNQNLIPFLMEKQRIKLRQKTCANFVGKKEKTKSKFA